MYHWPCSLALTLLLSVNASPVGAATEPQPLGWLAGHWCGGDPAEPVEEFWLPAKDDVMIGVSRTLKSGRTTGFEYLRIVPLNGRPTYFAQPGGRPATSFARTAGGVDWVQFENPEHDFPQRIEYRHTHDGLQAQISGPGEGDKEMQISFTFVRCQG